MTKEISMQDQLTEFLLYTSPNGDIKVEAFLHNETIWLSQKRIAELFGVNIATINEHLKNIYNSKELDEKLTIRNFLIVQKEGKREVKRNISFYNLDALLSVGYRVNSSQATQFRIWASAVLKEYIIKGFAMDDDRLKNGQYFGKDYFQELLERVRSIRASERRIYLQITDIFSECAIDYDSKSQITRNFFASIQNKFHYAITGKTAAEKIYETVDHKKPYAGLESFKNAPKGRVLKSDVLVGLNYLQEKEIKQLESLVSSYFDYIERMIQKRQEMKMEDLAESIEKFLEFNECEILEGKGKKSMKQAKIKAEKEYDEFNKTQKIDSDFEKHLKNLAKQK